MKDFLKFTLASCLGVFIAGTVVFLAMMGITAAIVASAGGGGGKTTVKSESILTLDFTQYLPEKTNNVATQSFDLNEQDVPGLHEVAKLIRHAAEDEKIAGLLIENGIGGLGPGSASIILEALKDYTESDKFLAAYGDYYTQQGYYLASAADHIVLHPVGTVDFRGFAGFVPFFKGLLDKIGIDMQIYYAGDFKSATEPFRRTEMSPENKLQRREYLNDVYDMFLQDIAAARGVDADSLMAMAWAFKIKNAEDALKYKLVDEIGSKAECEAWMKSEMGKKPNDKLTFISVDEYAMSAKLPPADYSVKDKIAVVYAEGDIVSGHDEYGVIDDGRYVKLIKDLRRQDDIKAVVLRINSPGGSILSAENIYRQLTGLKADGKPLVVSMGDYAASGGYYLSAMADSIFAQPATLTGSIGVFSMIPNPSRALDEKLGIRFDTVRTGPYSADFSVLFPWDERENNYVQTRVDAYYELFLNKVADGRDMSRDEVHAVAQGRIWSGRKALELGLVDRLGTLEDAIASAAVLADLEEYRIREYPVFQNPLQKMISDIVDPGNSAASGLMTTDLPQLMRFYEALQSGEPQARLPWGLVPVQQ